MYGELEILNNIDNNLQETLGEIGGNLLFQNIHSNNDYLGAAVSIMKE